MMTDDLHVPVTSPLHGNCKGKMLLYIGADETMCSLCCSYIMSNHVSCLGHLSLAVSFYDGMLKFFTSSHKEVRSSFHSSSLLSIYAARSGFCTILLHLLLSWASPFSKPKLFMSCLMLSIHLIIQPRCNYSIPPPWPSG